MIQGYLNGDGRADLIHAVANNNNNNNNYVHTWTAM